jgi:hypothetical protein
MAMTDSVGEVAVDAALQALHAVLQEAAHLLLVLYLAGEIGDLTRALAHLPFQGLGRVVGHRVSPSSGRPRRRRASR